MIADGDFAVLQAMYVAFKTAFPATVRGVAV